MSRELNVELCCTCRYYRRIDGDIGTCRADLPAYEWQDDKDTLPVGVWPSVEPTDYCGEWRAAGQGWLARLLSSNGRRIVADRLRELVK